MTLDVGVAGLAARREDQMLTELTQLVSGHSSKALELLVNHNLPSGLQAVFEAAADSEHYQQTLAAFTLQRQQRAEASQQAKEKEDHDRSEQAWLQSMSPEYRQAYAGLMTAINNADKEYDQDRTLLREHLQELDAEARDIDDQALHLSDGSRAYRNANGELVDKDGQRLKGAEAQEAQTLLKQHRGPVGSYEALQKNQQGHDKTNGVLQKIDDYQAKDHQAGREATKPKHPDVAKTNAGAQTANGHAAEIHARTAAVYGADKHTQKAANVISMADMADDAGPSANTATHSSFASQVNPNAGIHASSASASFNTAAQGTGAASVVVSPTPRPTTAPAPG